MGGTSPGDLRPLGQGFDGRRQGVGVGARPCLSEMFGRPAQDLVEVGLGGRRKPDPPGALCGHRFPGVPAA